MKLKEFRKKKGISQQEIAKLLEIDQKTYSNYENEKTKPTFDTMTEIAKILNCTVDELIGNEKKTSFETCPEKSKLLKTIESLTEIECHKLEVFAQGLISNRIAEQKQKITTLLKDSDNE